MKISHWFRKRKPQLLVQLVDSSVRYLYLEPTKPAVFGQIHLHESDLDGRMFDVNAVREQLFPLLGSVAAQVTVMLSCSSVHLHYLPVAQGLSEEEAEYHVRRHITHDLGLSLEDVYFDWALVSEVSDSLQPPPILILVARQSEVAQYAALFNDTNCTMTNVCAEQLVWLDAFAGNIKFKNYAVLQVEAQSIALFWFDEKGYRRALNKPFSAEQANDADFEYLSGGTRAPSFQLETDFVLDEMEALIAQNLGSNQRHLNMVHVFGAGVNWVNLAPKLQTRLGIPVQTAGLPEHVGVDEACVFGGLWHLSVQVEGSP